MFITRPQQHDASPRLAAEHIAICRFCRGDTAQQGQNARRVALDEFWARYRNKRSILSGRVIPNTKPSPAQGGSVIPLPRWSVGTKIDSAARCFMGRHRGQV